MTTDPLEAYGESEDCLFANVWVPKEVTEPLATTVFIHGGGFMIGSGGMPLYWGDKVVGKQRDPAALLVTFNYRLAIFGFYSSQDAGANFGLQDQQLLLRWVQDNIAAFGGDPARITLSGQSAGAMSVLSHLAAPGSRDLFHRALVFSAPGLHYRTPAENAPFVRMVAKAVGCKEAWNITKCMRSKPVSVLQAADPEYMFRLEGPCDNCDNILPWLPVIDGRTLPQAPIDAFRSGSHNKVPTIISSTSNETLAFPPTILRHAVDNELGFLLMLRTLFHDSATDIRQHYAASPDTAKTRDGAFLAGLISTDALFTCYARYVAKLLSAHAPVFLLTFQLPPTHSAMDFDHVCVRGPRGGASCHAADLNFYLPASHRMKNHGAHAGYDTQLEADRAEEFAATFVNFSAGRLGPFGLYSNSSDRSVSFDLEGFSNVTGYHRAHCDFFEGFPDRLWGGSNRAGQDSAETIVV